MVLINDCPICSLFRLEGLYFSEKYSSIHHTSAKSSCPLVMIHGKHAFVSFYGAKGTDMFQTFIEISI